MASTVRSVAGECRGCSPSSCWSGRAGRRRLLGPGGPALGHCRGGDVVVGPVAGAGYGDVGKTIDVRVHGTDHGTKPSFGTVIVLWALGAPIVALALWGLVAWWRRPVSAS